MRTLTPADQPMWRALRLEGLEVFPTAFLTTAKEQRNRPASEDRAQLAMGAWRGLFQKDDLVGLGAMIPFRYAAAAHRIEVGGFYITQDHQGVGAGQALMDAIVREAVGRGVLQLELSVAANNPRAVRFYERNGFIRMGALPRAIMIEGVAYDDLSYVRMLDQ